MKVSVEVLFSILLFDSSTCNLLSKQLDNMLTSYLQKLSVPVYQFFTVKRDIYITV